jgi:hypothetical protein
MVWVPLADDDPLPGDPAGLAELVTLLRQEAADMEDAVAQLRAVNSAEFWEGDAADAFTESRGDLVPDLELVIDRIQISAGALEAFIPIMEDCQRLGRVAVQRARDAETAVLKARLGAEAADRQAAADREAADRFADENPDVPPPPLPSYLGPNWTGLAEEAEQERALAERLFRQAVEDYEAAAHLCADRLHPAIADRLRNRQHRGFLGGVTHRVGELAGGAVHAGIDAAQEFARDTVEARDWLHKTVVDHLDEASELLGVAAMVTGFVPGMEGVSLAFAGAKLAVDTVAVFAADGDWKTVREDAIGFALFGVGRGLTGLARSRAGIAAAEKVTVATTKIRTIASEAVSAEQATQRTLEVARLGVQTRRYAEVTREFAQDASRPFMRETVAMLLDFGAELPDSTALSLSRSAGYAATAKRGFDAYGHYGDFRKTTELFEKYRIWPLAEGAG